MNGPAGRKRKTQHTKKDAMKFVAKILTIAAALSSLSMGANQVTVDSGLAIAVPKGKIEPYFSAYFLFSFVAGEGGAELQFRSRAIPCRNVRWAAPVGP